MMLTQQFFILKLQLLTIKTDAWHAYGKGFFLPAHNLRTLVVFTSPLSKRNRLGNRRCKWTSEYDLLPALHTSSGQSIARIAPRKPASQK